MVISLSNLRRLSFAVMIDNITYVVIQGSFKNGVVSAVLTRKTIDFTDFSGTFQDTAQADKQDAGHAGPSVQNQKSKLHVL